jgi:hypothetical protein
VTSVPYYGGPRDTSDLADVVRRLAATGLDLDRAWILAAGPFPVAGPARWSNDWHARRCEPYPHLHEGIDIFAPHGTPVVAIRDGRVSQKAAGAISGLGVEIVDDAGVQYFYAHLSAFHPGIEVGQQVEQGQVLGYIGTTGNARGTSPHVHLEVQPGGAPVAPKPYVDRWLEESHRSTMRMLREARRQPRPAVPELTRSARFERVTSLDPGQGVAVVVGTGSTASPEPIGTAIGLGLVLAFGVVTTVPLGIRTIRAGRGLGGTRPWRSPPSPPAPPTGPFV